ncbi:MAG: discoidin domain-containing protein [Bacillota bacterium]|nr:discoidin domain-containing protein [Bacillota bacterium]
MKKILAFIITLTLAFCITVQTTIPGNGETISAAETSKKAASVSQGNDLNVIKDKSGWTILASSNYQDTAKCAIDNDISTYWHSYYEATGPKITYHDTPPFTLTITLPKATYATGIVYTPRQQGNTGRITEYNVYVSTTDEDKPILLASGVHEDNTEIQKLSWYCNIPVKKIVFEALKGMGDYGSVAEIDLASEDKTMAYATDNKSALEKYNANRPYIVNRKGIIATCKSVWTEANTASMAFDGMSNSFWHSNPSDSANFPLELDVDLGEACDLTGFSYFPRQSDLIGHWTRFHIQVSEDGVNYKQVMDEFTFSSTDINKKLKQVDFGGAYPARYVKFIIDSAYGNHAAAGEINFYETKDSADRHAAEGKEKYVLQIDSKEIKVEKGNNVSYTKTIDVAPYIEKGTTMIPLRGLLEEMGAEVSWDGEYQKINLTKGKTKIDMQIINKLVYVYQYVNGSFQTIRYTFTVPPKIRSSRTFIPLRFVSEHLGYDVSWDGAARTITISKGY